MTFYKWNFPWSVEKRVSMTHQWKYPNWLIALMLKFPLPPVMWPSRKPFCLGFVCLFEQLIHRISKDQFQFFAILIILILYVYIVKGSSKCYRCYLNVYIRYIFKHKLNVLKLVCKCMLLKRKCAGIILNTCSSNT